MRTLALFFVLVCAYLGVSPASAELDDLELKLKNSENLQLRWDNVKDAPYHMGGPYPLYNEKTGFYTVSTEIPITLRLPQESFLRIRAVNGNIKPDDLEVLVSDGSGLYVEQKLQPVGCDLVLVPPNSGDYIVKIHAKVPGSVCFGFFRSRYEPPAPMAPYRDLVSTCGESKEIINNTNNVPEKTVLETYNEVSVGHPLNFKATGPVRLQISARPKYGPHDSGTTSLYDVTMDIDGHPFQVAHMVSQPDQEELFYEGIQPIVLGKEDRHFVEIPEGEHVITLRSNANALIQVHQLEDTGYLLRSLNAPDLADRPATPDISPLTLPESSLDVLNSNNSFKKLSPSHIEILARKLGKDNFWQAEGISSVYIMNQLYDCRRDDDSLKKARDRAIALFTFYRDLLPISDGGTRDQTFRYTYNWDLRNPEDEGKDTFSLSAFSDAFLEQLNKGYFYTLDKDDESALTYLVPPRSVPTYLKITAVHRDGDYPHDMWMQFDQSEPFKISLSGCERELPFDAYKPTHGNMGLAMLGDSNGTSGGLFNIRQTTGSYDPAGSLKIQLPPLVRQIKIWADAKNSSSVDISLQYQASKHFRLNYKMTKDYLCEVSHPQKVFFKAIDYIVKCSMGQKNDYAFNEFWSQLQDAPSKEKNAIAELYNHWLPLFRLLAARHQRFISEIGEVNKSLMSKNNLHFDNIDKLFKDGELFLAERYLKTIFLKSTDESIQERAYQKLCDYLETKPDYFTLVGVLVEHYLKTNDAKDLEKISKVLEQDQLREPAIDIAQILEASHHEMPVNAKFAILREQLKDVFPPDASRPEETSFWKAQGEQIQGNFEKAVSLFKSAGEQGKIWADHLSEGTKILHNLITTHPDQKIREVKEWAVWYRNHPGPYYWKSANELVVQSSGTNILYSPVLDKFSFSYVAKPTTPIKLQIVGPAKVRFEVRMLFDKDGEKGVREWLTVVDNDTPKYLPLLNALPTEDLKLIGVENKPSLLNVYVLNVDRGLHTLLIKANKKPLLVSPYIQEPVLPLGALPPVNKTTISTMLGCSQTPCDSNQLKFSFMENNGCSNLKEASANPICFKTKRVDSKLLDQVLYEIKHYPFLKNYEYSDQEKAFHHMAGLLKSYEQSLLIETLQAAHRLWKTYKDNVNIYKLWNRFLEFTSWESVEVVEGSAGIRSLSQIDAWDPDVPGLALRKSLLDEAPDEYVLTGPAPLIFQFYNQEKTHVRLRARLGFLIADDYREVQWGYQLDEGEIVYDVFTPGDRSTEKILTVAEGEHSLRIFIKDPTENTFVRLNIDEKRAQEKEWHDLKVEAFKNYFVATRNEPVVITVVGPAWIRIDELVNGKLQSNDFFVSQGPHKITLRPSAGKEEGLYRIYERVKRTSALAEQQVPVSSDYLEVEKAPVSICDCKPFNPLRGKRDVLPLGGQENGTLSLSAGLVRRLAFDVNEPNPSTDSLDRFGEESLTYRYFDHLTRIYWRGDVLTRQRKDGDPTIGAIVAAEYSPIDIPITFWMIGKAYTQHILGKFANSETFIGGLGISSSLIKNGTKR